MPEYSSCRITEHREKGSDLCFIWFRFVLVLAFFSVVLGNLICK